MHRLNPPPSPPKKDVISSLFRGLAAHLFFNAPRCAASYKILINAQDVSSSLFRGLAALLDLRDAAAGMPEEEDLPPSFSNQVRQRAEV